MHRFLFLSGIISLVVLSTGCEKQSNNIVDPPPTANPTFTSGNVKEASVYYSFDAGKEAPQWDVKFGEYTMPPAPQPVPMPVTNPALLGDMYVAVYNSRRTTLDDVMKFPADSLSRDSDGNTLSASWYDYNPVMHTLSSKGFVYVIKGSDGRTYKFRINDYTGKIFTVSYSYRKSDSTWSPAQTATVDINAGEKYFSFSKGQITPAPWDVKLTVLSMPTPIGPMNFPGIALNRELNVTAKIVNGTGFDSVDPAAETGLTKDTDTSFVIGTECLKYDENSHRLNPYDNRTFVISTIAGKRVKVRMLGYYNDQGASGYMKFEYIVK